MFSISTRCTSFAGLEGPPNKQQKVQQTQIGSDSSLCADQPEAAAEPRPASTQSLQPAAPDAANASNSQDAAPSEHLHAQHDLLGANISVPTAAPAKDQTGVPDNNTVLWEPLLVRVRSQCCMQSQTKPPCIACQLWVHIVNPCAADEVLCGSTSTHNAAGAASTDVFCSARQSRSRSELQEVQETSTTVGCS